jgi:hypothetical protein
MTAYMISQVEVLDDSQWQRYGEIAAPAIAQYGGRCLVRRAIPEVAEGDWAPPHPEGQQDDHDHDSDHDSHGGAPFRSR